MRFFACFQSLSFVHFGVFVVAGGWSSLFDAKVKGVRKLWALPNSVLRFLVYRCTCHREKNTPLGTARIPSGSHFLLH